MTTPDPKPIDEAAIRADERRRCVELLLRMADGIPTDDAENCATVDTLHDAADAIESGA